MGPVHNGYTLPAVESTLPIGMMVGAHHPCFRWQRWCYKVLETKLSKPRQIDAVCTICSLNFLPRLAEQNWYTGTEDTLQVCCMCVVHTKQHDACARNKFETTLHVCVVLWLNMYVQTWPRQS
jgi:hypothetical protein